ncbi:17017_t:CDS:2 [Acaulospora colombiana]|uniref:17017_t:CDS:1 n=1 Tax=Acaulospora colombiana TaxID=27376 RepID=A0ACA9K8B7_9GLOM|nr:17017_t:CDS:2 [Acaulospora colombiana]
MCPLQLTYDAVVTYIKYSEGYLMVPVTGEIITKPEEYWNNFHQQVSIPLDYVLGNEVYTEAMPQLAYGAIMFIIALLGVRSNQRFSRLLGKPKISNAPQANIVAKLEYFKEMNQYLTCALFIGSASIIALSVDALTPARFLNTHKFAIDLLICHANFTIWIVFVTLILIFYPSANSLPELVTEKGLASTIVIKSMKASENSPWSSQIISKNDRVSWYLDMPDDSSSIPSTPITTKNYHDRNFGVFQSGDGSVTLDIFPPQSTSPHGPQGAPSSFYFSSNALLPSPTYPPQVANQNSVLPPRITTQHNSRRSVSFSKPSPVESLKYPSSPVKNRNSLTSLNSLPTFPPPITPPPTTSPPPIPTSKSVPVTSIMTSLSTGTSPKRTQRSVPLNVPNTPIIRVTDSQTSLRSKALFQEIGSDVSVRSKVSQENNDTNVIVNEKSTINATTKLDTRVVAPFMFQDEPPPRVVTVALANDRNEENMKDIENATLNIEQRKYIEKDRIIETNKTINDSEKQYLKEDDGSGNEKQTLETSSFEYSQEEVQSDFSNADEDSFALEKSLIKISPSIKEGSDDEKNSLLSSSISPTKSSSSKSATPTLTITTKSSLQATSQKPKSTSRTNTVKTSSAVTPLKSALKTKSPTSKSQKSTASPVSSESSSRTSSPTSPSTPVNSLATPLSRVSTPINNNKKVGSNISSRTSLLVSNNNKAKSTSTGNSARRGNDVKNRVIKNSPEAVVSGNSKNMGRKSEGAPESYVDKHVGSKDTKNATDKPQTRERSDSGFHGDDLNLIVPSESSYLEIGKDGGLKNEKITSSSREKNIRSENKKMVGSKSEKKANLKSEKTVDSKDEKKKSKDSDLKSDKSNRSSLKDVKKIMGRIRSSSSLSTSSSESSRSSSSNSKSKKISIRMSGSS